MQQKPSASIAHLGTIWPVESGAGVASWISRHSGLVTAAAAYAVLYFLLIRQK
jgi:hypothetical protein